MAHLHVLLRPLALIILLSSNGIAQTFECEYEGNPGLHAPFDPPDPECNPENLTEICVRVKFHFLNNTTDPMTSPSDEQFVIMLTRLNEVFRPGKIRLTFDGECIHRDEIPIEIETSQDFYYYMFDGQVFDPPEETEYDGNFLNVYFIQNLLGRSRANYPEKFCVVGPYDGGDDYYTLIHEVGHLFSLDHTFGTNGDLYDTEDVNNYCNNPAAIDPISQDLRCRVFGDGICDTPPDPFSFDLNDDGKIDQYMWGDCFNTKPELFSYLDGCGSNAWSPPYSNFMSYYALCAYEFTPCQLGLANEQIALDYPEVVVSCTYSDIVIDEPVVWSNTTVELEPHQRIIIKETGKLTIDNCTLTLASQTANGSCPDLVDMFWDGIYIEGRSSEIVNNQTVFYGSLYVEDGSLIEYSRNGIQALSGFHEIDIDESSMENNLNAIQVRDPWPYSASTPPNYRADPCGYYLSNPPPKVRIFDSEINVFDKDGYDFINIGEVQISTSGAIVSLNDCQMSNPNGNSENITAVMVGRGKLSMLNGSSISDFRTGIEKLGDIYIPCGERGLYVRHSSILNARDALVNTGQFVSVTNSWIEGNVYMEGLSSSTWRSNNMECPTFAFLDPKEAAVIHQNKLTVELQTEHDNLNSHATCNECASTGFVVIAVDGSQLPPSWGLSQKASGNKFLTMSAPTFFSEDPDIINYHAAVPNQQFNYEGDFSGSPGDANSSCVYNSYPGTPPSSVSNYTLPGPIDYEVLNEKWQNLDSIRNVKVAGLNSATPTQAKLLQQQIAALTAEMSDTTRVALSAITDGDFSLDSIWRPRGHVLLDSISELRMLFYSGQFDPLMDSLVIIGTSDALALLDATEYLQSVEVSGESIFDLRQVHLDSLMDLAALSYGDHSNILRDFLALEYRRSVRWPVDTSAHSAKLWYSLGEKGNSVIVYPNPTTDCVQFVSDKYAIEGVKVFDFMGRSVPCELNLEENKVCLANGHTGVYAFVFGGGDNDVVLVDLIR